MRILLDTHAFLWAMADDPRLGPISRGDMPISAVQALAWAEESGFDWLPLAPGHILCLVEDLPHPTTAIPTAARKTSSSTAC